MRLRVLALAGGATAVAVVVAAVVVTGRGGDQRALSLAGAGASPTGSAATAPASRAGTPSGTPSGDSATGEALATPTTAPTDATASGSRPSGSATATARSAAKSTPTTSATPSRAATRSAAARPAPTTTAPKPAPGNQSSPAHFGTLPVGAALPSGAQCAAWVRSVPAPREVKGVNAAANATTGRPVAGATGLLTRVDGNFTGTTEQILRWAACKWGVDEDVVKAQAAVESWWRIDTKGDWGTDAARCAPGHGLGADGKAGQCPESWGLLQIRYPYNQAAFPWARTSSAFNADWAYAQWRTCFTGGLSWLNTVERGKDYAAGDATGCLGVWFSGRWYTQPAKDYIAKVTSYRTQRIWTTPDFAQP